MKMQTKHPLANRYGKFSVLIVLCAIMSCVTVNVNFPESAVERAANDFVNDLYKKAGKKAPNETTAATKDADAIKNKKKKKKNSESAKPANEPTTFRFELITSAYAQELNTRTSTANKIQSEMATRLGEINKLKTSGAICEKVDGFLRLKDASKASNPAAANQLIQQENDARRRLFDEIKSANPNVQKEMVVNKFSAAFRRAVPNSTCD